MLTKLLLFILILSILKVAKEVIRVVTAFYKNDKYESSFFNTTLTWSSISYIITIILCGL